MAKTSYAPRVLCCWVSLCNLCDLCVCVVEYCSGEHHRDTEITEVAQRRTIFGQAELRRFHDAGHDCERAQMVSVVIGNQQCFTQNCLTITVRYFRVQIC